MNNKDNKNKVLILGRMNVGKSTLFNKLTEDKKSITLDYLGITRDFIKEDISWKDYNFTIIDSGGINIKDKDEITKKVNNQVISLIEQSSVIVFVLDGKVGISNEDLEISKILHKSKKNVILAINKIDNIENSITNIHEFQKLGFKIIVPISAEHGLSINDLLDKIILFLDKKYNKNEKSTFKIALIGKPNVGKSSLMNVLLNNERSIVSSIEGTTREAFSENIKFSKNNIEIFDTPGIRKKSSVSDNIEELMVKSSFRTLKNSDIILLIIDGSKDYILDQDLKLAFYGYTQQYKCLIIIINKSDLATNSIKASFINSLKDYHYLYNNVERVEISCKTQKNVGKILPLVYNVWQRYNYRFNDNELSNLIISEIQKKHLYRSKQAIRVYEARQIDTKPPTIELLVNNIDIFDDNIIRFFENIIRDNYNLKSCPIKFILKKYIN
jgi:GTP-binding protein